MADQNQYSSDQEDQDQKGSLGGQATDQGNEGTNKRAQEEDSDMAE